VPDTPDPSSADLAKRIYAAVGHEFNLDSPQVVQRVLVDEMKVPLVDRNKVGFRVDSETLRALPAAQSNDVVQLLLQWRERRAEERRGSASTSRILVEDMVDYDEIARIMNVKAQTVRVYAGRDPDFPPVVAMVGRTPLRSRDAILRYLEVREARVGPQGGRPPRPTVGV
jgi:hypothetical protein